MHMILSIWKQCRQMASRLHTVMTKYVSRKGAAPADQAASETRRNPRLIAIFTASMSLVLIAGVVYGASDRHDQAIAQDQPLAAHTKPLYEVTVDGVSLGLVSSPQVVESYIHDRYQQVQAEHPHMDMKLTYGDIAFHEQEISQATAEDEEVLAKLAPHISSHTVAVAIRIDGELIGYVRDQQAADALLSQIKQPYDSERQSAPTGDVRIASVSTETPEADEASHVLDRRVDFLEEVEEQTVLVQPDELSDPEQLAEQIQTGGVKPVTYIVQEGDTIYAIARRFDIKSEVIYRNNPWIENDLLHPGDELNLTVWQPLLSVKVTQTVERKEEIPFPIEYEIDPDMLEGQIKVISEGISGERIVTVEETTVNGVVTESQEIHSVVIKEPVAAKYVRGSKAVTGMDELVQKLLGTPYVWGGTTPSGFDCSGFTKYVMSKYGVDLPRTSASQAEAGSHVAKADLRKGDLVFFNTYGPAGSITHVAIYMGDGKIANALSKKVEINDLNDDYFSKRYITARRVLTDEQYEAIH